MLFLSCFCYAFMHVCLLMPCGHMLRKGLTSWLSFVMSNYANIQIRHNICMRSKVLECWYDLGDKILSKKYYMVCNVSADICDGSHRLTTF